MPSQTANLTALRADGTTLAAYMSVFRGAEVFRCTAAETPSDKQVNLSVTAVSGDAADVKPGFRVDVLTAGGAAKGRTRVRYGGTISSTNLPLREWSAGQVDIASGDTLVVYAEVRLDAKIVSATRQFKPDNLAYSDEGANPPPLPCSGGAWAGFADMAPIPFTGSASIAVDPDSGGTLSHAWTFPTGLTADDDTAANPSVTSADAGSYLVAHAVTDDSNGKTTTQYVPVIVHDDDHPPYEVIIEDIQGDEENGHSATVQVFADAALSDIPDGAFVILWMEQRLAGTVQAFGLKSSGRSHLLLTGYLRRETGDYAGESGVESLRFEVISPMARLAELVGYSKVMTSDATPDKWSELKTLTVKRGIVQLAQFYTNLGEAGFDFVIDSNYSDAVYPEFFIQKSTPLAQMRELADGRDARLTCDRSGRFSLHTRPELYAVASRAAATKTITLTTDDLIDWRYTREHWRTVELLEARGFTAGASGNTPVFSRAPGLAPGYGSQNITVERLIADSQSDLNSRAGRRYAAADGVYTDASGVQQLALDLELTLPPGYHVADFYDEYVALTLTTALRGLDLSEQLFVLKSVALEPDDSGAWRTKWTLRTATNGAAGVTYRPAKPNDLPDFNSPSVSWGTLPTVTPGPFDWGDLDDTAAPVKLFGVTAASDGAAYRATAWNPTTGSILWESIGGSGNGLTGTGVWASADPFNYRRRFVITSDGLFKCDDIWAATPAWSQVATNLQMLGNATWVGNCIRMSINRQGFIVVTSGPSCVAISNDYGASWTQASPLGGSPTGSGTPGASDVMVAVSPHNSSADGVLYAVAYAETADVSLLESNTVLANGTVASTATATDASKTYMVRAIGDGWRLDVPGNTQIADAQWWSNSGTWLGGGADNRRNNLIINGSRPSADDPTWNSDHEYRFTVAGTGSAFTFKCYDEFYEDNPGSITVELYEVVRDAGVAVYKSPDWGSTWLQSSSAYAEQISGPVIVPYALSDGNLNHNGASQLIYASFGGTIQNLLRSDDGGDSWTAYSGEAFPDALTPQGLNTYTLNGAILHYRTSTALRYSLDSGATRGTSIATGAAGNVNGWPNDSDIALLWDTTNLVYVSSVTGGLSVALTAPSADLRYVEWDLSDYVPASS